ncbi:MAG: hypothetical protein QCH96_01870 [Candidatus Thermoplasmatota archaeon]|nr:hypothetical protein [Candidatus Thermoplasmatota archaeon]
MFETRTKKERMIIYIVIAFLVTILLAFMHHLQGWLISWIIVGGVIEFFCIFYILYLPLKMKKE